MLSFWNEFPPQKRARNRKPERPNPEPGLHAPRTCLMGVGSDLRGDDSVGLVVARALIQDPRVSQAAHLLVVEGGPAPENHTGQLRAFCPEIVLLIDAADMRAAPGTIRWIPPEDIDGMSASSHSLPLSILASFLTFELGCDVAILGIQPEQNNLDADLSPRVRAAVDEILLAVERTLVPQPG